MHVDRYARQFGFELLRNFRVTFTQPVVRFVSGSLTLHLVIVQLQV